MRQALMNKNKLILILLPLFVLGCVLFVKFPSQVKGEDLPYAIVEKRAISVGVRATGELETARSVVIASTIKGDQAKLIYLIPEGTDVKVGDLLIKIDSSPFEERLNKIQTQIKEHKSQIEALVQAFEWEKTQTAHEIKAVAHDVETAQMELEKLIHGDGPLEIAKLKSATQKSFVKYEEIRGYSEELEKLRQEGFLHPSEIKQAEKKLLEEKESYESAKLQYESYLVHVYPMLAKKAESQYKKAQLTQEDKTKSAEYRIAKATVALNQAKRGLRDLNMQLNDAQKELELTEIKAPGPGMVVHRDEFRMGQRRKPRVGDVLIKNQPLLDLPDLDSMVVKAKVRELDLYKVGIGKQATIQIDAYPQLVLKGQVTAIGVLAMTDHAEGNEEKYFELRISLYEPDKALRPGMTARVIVHAFEKENILTVPVHAVFEDIQQNYCYVQSFLGHEKRSVQIGISNEHYSEIISGLNEGDTICLVDPLGAQEK